MNTLIAKHQQKTDYANRRYKKVKGDTYVGEKLAASVNVEGIGTVNRTYTCVALYPYFAQFSYQTRSGVTLYEAFNYTDVGFIREYHKISDRWVRDFEAS